MKVHAVLLALSLTANAALLAGLARRAPGAPPAASAGSARPAAVPAAAAVAARPAIPAVGEPAVPATLWSRLHSENLDEFNRRLRAAGFPPKLVRLLLANRIFAWHTGERNALLGRPEDLPYWKYPYTNTPEQQARMTEIYQESSALDYRYVSGPDALADDEEARAMARRRYGNLPLEKLQQVVALQHDFEQTQLRAELNLRGATDPSARGQAYAAMERELMDQLARILTPDELEQYELRTRGMGLAQQLAAFKPTEEEFKAIYRLEKARREATPATPGSTPAQRQEEFELAAATALGAERALDYFELRKAGSDRLPLLIARLDLPISTLGRINAVRADIGQRAQAIGNDSSLTRAQRDARLNDLVAEAGERLTAAMGSQRGYEAYMDLKGDWVRNLRPPPGGGP